MIRLTSSARLFLSLTVSMQKDPLWLFILAYGISNFVSDLGDDAKNGVEGMSTSWLTILYNIVTLALALLSISETYFSFENISPTPLLCM